MRGYSGDLLKDRTVLVTGASSGIGRGVARLVADVGGRVVLAGRDLGRLDETLKQLPGAGHSIEASSLDDSDQVAEWCKGVSGRVGGLDGVFHGAGIELIRPLRMTKAQHLRDTFASSFDASFGLLRAVASKDVMRDGVGSVVLMSSVASLRGQIGMAAYGAAKAATDALVRSAATEMAARRIRVNSLAAGAVRTEMHERLIGRLDPSGVADYEARHLLGFGSADDIASAAVFLLSELGRWVTGATWVVDGGYTTR